MRYLWWALAAAVALVAVVALVGWMVPVVDEASRTAHFDHPPDQVDGTIAGVASYANWVEGVSRVETLDSVGGRVRYRQHSTTGPLVMEVDTAVPPSRFVTRIADPDQPFGGTWTFDITPENGGARLTITERGEIYNPIFRCMARFVFGYTATMEGYLRSLGKKLGAA